MLNQVLNKIKLFKILSLFSVVRGYNIVFIIIAQFISAIYFFSENKSFIDVVVDLNIWIIIFCSAFSISAGYIVNSIYDSKKDLINRPLKTTLENQISGINPHDDLSFEESADVIIKHVKNGISLAKENNLPDELIDFIRTHHGTTMVGYFYKQYVASFPEEIEAAEKFTYPGPKPFSKETAVLMMADSVEAAARSLKSPTLENIDKLVESIINTQIDNEQFVNADITMKSITQIKKLFKKKLQSIHHVRVEY